MNTLENPPGFIIRTEAQKAAWDNGYHLERGAEGAWLRYTSTTAKGDIWLAAASPAGPWFVAVDHPGVASELTGSPASIAGPGVARFFYASLSELYPALERLYQLAVSLPDSKRDRMTAYRDAYGVG
jgi:hypothetical protein